jgi:hypothetical protein
MKQFLFIIAFAVIAFTTKRTNTKQTRATVRRAYPENHYDRMIQTLWSGSHLRQKRSHYFTL